MSSTGCRARAHYNVKRRFPENKEVPGEWILPIIKRQRAGSREQGLVSRKKREGKGIKEQGVRS
jgi:hypothetical protein